MEKTIWKDHVDMIIHGIILSSIAGGFYMVFQIIGGISQYADLVSMKGSLELNHYFDNVWFKWSVFALLLTIGGYLLYWSGLSAFEKIQDENDKGHIRLLRNCVLCNLCGAIVWMIPLVGWFMMGILNLITFILMVITYNRLRNSPTFPPKAREGALLLFIAMLINIIQIPVGIIPVWGAIIGGSVTLVAFVLMLCGWMDIKNAEPATENGRRMVPFSSFSQIPGGTRLTWGLVILLLVYGVLLTLKHMSSFIIWCGFWEHSVGFDMYEKIRTVLSYLKLASLLVGFCLFYSAIHTFQSKGIVSCGKAWGLVGTIFILIHVLGRCVLGNIENSEITRVGSVVVSLFLNFAWVFLAIAIGRFDKEINLTAKGYRGIKMLQGCMWGIVVIIIINFCFGMISRSSNDHALAISPYWGIGSYLHIILSIVGYWWCRLGWRYFMTDRMMTMQEPEH